MAEVTQTVFSAGEGACSVRFTYDDVTLQVSLAEYTLLSGQGTFAWNGGQPVDMKLDTHGLIIPGSKFMGGTDGFGFTWAVTAR